MPKPKLTVRPKKLTLHLPGDLGDRLDLELFSALEGRVPHAAYSRFIGLALRERFESAELNLAPFVGHTEPLIVRAPRPIIDLLKEKLNAQS